MNKYEKFIGKILDERYRILELVGTGGMAFVLKAEDIVMNRIVAIKILNDEFNGNEQAETRFINESKAVAMLSHKNIVSIYDVAIYPDMKYIVMEFLDGITLREYLDNKKALSWKEASIYIIQILRALEHAHSKGIIHRDIKPQNVMLQKDGQIKVTDFGIAKIPGSASLTMTENAVGTVYYISPEQASGKETTHSSDLYSVGIMFYEAATGYLPFNAESPIAIAMKQVSDEAQNPRIIVPTLPEGVAQIIMKSLEKNPEDRFSSAHSMSKAIEWVIRNPEVVFLVSPSEEGGGEPTASVSIDMINTGELEQYASDDIVESMLVTRRKERGHSTRRSKKKKKSKNKQEKAIRPSRTFFPIISAIAVSFLVVAVILGATIGIKAITIIFMPGSETEEASFPHLVGKVYSDELVSQLKNGAYGPKFTIKEVQYVNNPDYENGHIVSQDPVGGNIGKKNANEKYYVIEKIIVSSKLSEVELPNLAYYDKTSAQMLLSGSSYQLDVNIVTEDNPNYFNNQVISMSPDPGTVVKVGTTVELRVCARTRSNSTSPMPNLEGMTRGQAIEMLRYTQYEYEFVEIYSYDGTGTVTLQDVAPGTVSEKGTKVTVSVSVRQSGNIMPDLRGKTLTEALTSIYNISLLVGDDRGFDITSDYVTSRNLQSTLESMSYQEALEYLIGQSLELSTSADKSKGIVIYQSVAPNTSIEDVSEVMLIYYIPF